MKSLKTEVKRMIEESMRPADMPSINGTIQVHVDLVLILLFCYWKEYVKGR